MLIYALHQYKIAIFWTHKVGHASMYFIIRQLKGMQRDESGGISRYTHNNNINMETISSYKWILIYRNPFTRVCSSFLLKRAGAVKNVAVKDNVSFKQYLNTYETYNNGHYSIQANGKGYDVYKKFNRKFDYMVETNNMNDLAVILTQLTGQKINGEKIQDERYWDKSAQTNKKDIENLPISEIRIIKPEYSEFYKNPEIEQIVRKKLSKDFEFFASLGIHFSPSS